MSTIDDTVTEISREISELRAGRGRSRTGAVELLRKALDALLKAGVEPARDAGCRCDESPCKYPLCNANRE